MQVTKQLRTETGHRLTNYDGRCSHLHGHSYLFEVTAKCDDEHLDSKNMVMDFKDLKKAMNVVLDPLDHCMVLGKDDPLWSIDLINGDAECCELSDLFVATNGQAPRLMKWHENPTAESFAQWALDEINHQLSHLYHDSKPDGASETVPYFISNVRVWETATSYAEATK